MQYFTVPDDGYYLITGLVTFSSNANGFREVFITNTTSNYVMGRVRVPAVSGGASTLQVTSGGTFGPGQTGTLSTYQNSGSNLNVQEWLNMVKIAYDALDDKLAEDIKIIDIRSISVLADYFIIADGNNKNQVQAMVDNVQEELFKAGYEMKQMEGYREGNWILLDFGDIIIHIFDKENRLFYDLERIWKDGKEVSIEELN